MTGWLAQPNDRRQQLLSLRCRIKRQLRALTAIRVELHEINADQFMRPVTADDYPWLLAIEPTRRALAAMLVGVEDKLSNGPSE
jgi:hypothetical protein